MKLVILSILSIIITSTASAQVRGPRYNPPGGGTSRSTTTYHPGNGRTHTQTTYYGNGRTTTYYPSAPHATGPRVIGPRYNPPGSSRYIRTTRRPQVIWSTGFGYTCNIYGELQLNGRHIHTFRFSSDCSTALSDIQYYGDFCDYEDLYDQTGYLEAQFNYSSECRSALGWYY